MALTQIASRWLLRDVTVVGAGQRKSPVWGAVGKRPLATRVGVFCEKRGDTRLHFLHKLDKDSGPLRDGSVDLETGVVDQAIGPEVRAQALFQDRYVGVVRVGHPLSEGEITPARFAAARHVHVSRRDGDKGPNDEALTVMGLERQIATIVGGFSAALALVRASDLVACVHERHTGVLYAGMHSFALPVPIAPFTVSLLWHPRLDGDPAHRWLRGCIRGVCAEQLPAE